MFSVSRFVCTHWIFWFVSSFFHVLSLYCSLQFSDNIFSQWKLFALTTTKYNPDLLECIVKRKSFSNNRRLQRKNNFHEPNDNLTISKCYKRWANLFKTKIQKTLNRVRTRRDLNTKSAEFFNVGSAYQTWLHSLDATECGVYYYLWFLWTLRNNALMWTHIASCRWKITENTYFWKGTY